MSDKNKRAKITTTMTVDSNGRETFTHEAVVNWCSPRTASSGNKIINCGGEDELSAAEEMATDLLEEIKRVRSLVAAHSESRAKR